MYESGPDRYCYPGTNILVNRLGLRDRARLEEYEAMITAQRAEEPLPRGRLGYAHYRAIHRHLFQDVFDWAGKPRTVRIAKGGSMFCFPEQIDGEMRKLFDRLRRENFLRRLAAPDFAAHAAHMLAELNAIHPFREGNGRAQLTYLTLLAEQADHPLAMERMNPSATLAAMVASFQSDEAPLAALIEGLITP
jgi:cell filamentation protein